VPDTGVVPKAILPGTLPDATVPSTNARIQPASLKAVPSAPLKETVPIVLLATTAVKSPRAVPFDAAKVNRGGVPPLKRANRIEASAPTPASWSVGVTVPPLLVAA
jgi:hypothetical protein